MFSGIVEAVAPVVSIKSLKKAYQICIKKPSDFDDLKVGDSVAVDGVCLTVENFDSEQMTFTIAAETLQVTGWTEANLSNARLNLERSLRMGDRIHGHLVAGHVDGVGEILSRERDGESLWYWIQFPKELAPMFWKKGSVSLKGVSLTINEVKGLSLSVCLIPETLRQTNLSDLLVGEKVNLEVDTLARAMIHYMKTEGKA